MANEHRTKKLSEVTSHRLLPKTLGTPGQVPTITPDGEILWMDNSGGSGGNLNSKEDKANKSNDSTFAANSVLFYPTQRAVKTALENLEDRVSNPENQTANVILIAITDEEEYILDDSMNGTILVFDNEEDLDVIIPEELKEGFNCLIQRDGVGEVRVKADTGVTLNSANLRSQLRARYSGASLVMYKPEVYSLTGDIIFSTELP